MCDTVVNNLFIVFWRFDFLYFLALFPFDFFITLSTLGGSVVGGGSRKRDHRDFDSGPAACPLDPVPKSQDLWCESSTNIQRIFTLDFLILGLALPPPPFPRTAVKILQKTAFSLVKSRLALRSLACLFVCLFVTMRKMASYTGKWLLLPPSDHIHMWNPFTDQTGPGKRNNWSFAQTRLDWRLPWTILSKICFY